MTEVWSIASRGRAYPEALLALDEGERPRLYGVGDRRLVAGLDSMPRVTIVGSRRASSYGCSVAQTLGHDLALAGVVVISGMALGIDAAAHQGALEAGGRTITVLAGGPDRAYPASHRRLHERIAQTGAVISEHPPGSGLLPRHFAQRNRIMAALGEVIVIVEAAQPSGSLITADVGLRLGRTVAAVPGQIGTRVAAGSNDLIKDGAQLIRDARDVLDLLFGVGESAQPRAVPGATPRSTVLVPRPGPLIDRGLGRLLDLVRAGTPTVDRLVLDSGEDPRAVAVGLARLERLGYIRADAIGGYAATGLQVPQ